ncbi:MAG: bacillithiol biosynthesis BshC [Candidatus Kapabacteria bacterium]|nr:bacillithiol biosynthesis BshC [Candidatus Kapabacteria bacterium]
MLFSTEFSESITESQIFRDFISGNPIFKERFPLNSELFAIEGKLPNIAQSFTKRDAMLELLRNSMSCIQPCEIQQKNLKALEYTNSMVVYTNLSVSFLGGSIENYLKIFSAVSLVEKLEIVHRNYKFVPILWVDDSDYVSTETASTATFDKDYNILNFSLENDPNKSNFVCSNAVINDSDFEVIQKIADSLSETEYSEQLKNSIIEFYKQGTTWANAFIGIINSWFSVRGLLFIKTSSALKQGVFAHLNNLELSAPGHSSYILNQSHYQLELSGYGPFKPGESINLFFHQDNSKYQISSSRDNAFYRINDRPQNLKDIVKMNEENASLFSPGHVLMPVYQNSILPAAAIIADEREITDLAASKELFEYCEVNFPCISSRHSITFIDVHTRRFLDKNHLNTSFFLRDLHEIDEELKRKYYDTGLERQIDHIRERIEYIFEELNLAAKKLNKLIEQKTEDAKRAVNHQISELEIEMQNAQIFKHKDIFDSYNKASNFLYPDSKLQERVYSPLAFIAKSGIENFNKTLNGIISFIPNKHFFINLT